MKDEKGPCTAYRMGGWFRFSIINTENLLPAMLRIVGDLPTGFWMKCRRKFRICRRVFLFCPGIA
ncbi:hypothetical protein D3C85_1444090 [compost metagenome]